MIEVFLSYYKRYFLLTKNLIFYSIENFSKWIVSCLD